MSTTHIQPLPNVRGRMSYTELGEGKKRTRNIREKTNRIAAQMGDMGTREDFIRFCSAMRRQSQGTRLNEGYELRVSWSPEELSKDSPEDIQRACEYGYALCKEVAPNAPCWVTVHTDGEGGCVHVHATIANHDLVSGAAVSWLTSYLLTRPLGTLSRASRELARGNLGYRAPVRSRDEVGQLAADFNRMAGQLERNVNRIQETMALQERFMADFSHEMKTPMTSIIGYADLLRSQVLTPDEQMDAANYIFSEGKRLEALGLKLLDMLSLDQSKLQLVPAHPADLVAGLLEHLKRLYAQKGIALQYRTEEGACFLEPDLFKTLLVNLMDNARKALDSGGNIYVWQEMLPDGCRVRVLDNGRGIPPEALAHLTEAFYRVDKSRSRAQGGAGLGLSLCNEIVQLHGGTMQFESRVGNGTVVTVELKGGRV